jgi:hypothetical protein
MVLWAWAIRRYSRGVGTVYGSAVATALYIAEEEESQEKLMPL